MKRKIALLLAVILLLSCVAWAETLQADSESIEPLAMSEGARDALEPKASKAETLKVRDKSTETIYIGKTYQLVVSGKKIKSCKSSNSKVVKVSKTGLVTPLKVGTAKATITLKNGKKLKVSLKSRKKETTKELKDYFDKDLEKTAKQLGLKAYNLEEEQDDDIPFNGYRNEYVAMCDSYDEGYINTIILLKKSKYTLFGIQVGMKKSEAQSKEAKYFEVYWKDYEDEPYLDISYENGRVSRVFFGFID